MANAPNKVGETVKSDEPAGTSGRPLLLFLGFAVLGIALIFILFSEDLFGAGLVGQESAATGSVLEQVPASGGTAVVAQQAAGTDDRPAPGQQAPDFSLADLEGNEVSLSNFRGQPVIINFWATWCGPCRIEMPELQKAYEEGQKDGLNILAVNLEESPQTVSRFFYDDLGLTFTPLLDSDGQVASLYGVFNLPTTYFINPEGTIAAVHRGPLTGGQIDSLLRETISGEG